MNEALSSDIDGHPHNAHNAPGAGVTYSIKVLGEASSEDGRGGQRLLFSRIDGDEVIEIRTETDGGNLLAKLPDLLDAALEIQRSLWAVQRTVARLPASFFPRLAEESRLVRWLALGSASDDRADMDRRHAAREAMIVRDVAWEAIRYVLPPDRRGEVDSLVGAHERSPELGASMEAIAALIETMLVDPEDSELLAACDVDGAYAASLRHKAAGLVTADA